MLTLLDELWLGKNKIRRLEVGSARLAQASEGGHLQEMMEKLKR